MLGLRRSLPSCPRPRVLRLCVRMVEGHGVHRVAAAHREQLRGKAFKASSPNGRFEEGAKLIDGKILHAIEAYGKNLLYRFGEGAAAVVVHVHFGSTPPVAYQFSLC